MSIARRTLPSRLELKSFEGSFNDAPLAKVSFTTDLYDSPVQMMPSCDQTGVPIHFHSSTTSGSASLMSLRILPSVAPRQSPSSAIFFEMSCDADWPSLTPDFFMFSSSKFRILHQQCDANGANGTVAHRGDRKAPIAARPSQGDDRKQQPKTADAETEKFGKQAREALVGKSDNHIRRRLGDKKPGIHEAQQQQQPSNDAQRGRDGHDP